MFHANNLPRSLVGDVAKLLGETNTDYSLPDALQSKVQVAAGECAVCMTREDRRNICEQYLAEVYGDDLSEDHRANFHAAVEYAMQTGNFQTSTPADAKPEVLSEVKKVKMVGKMPYGFSKKSAKGMQAADTLKKKKNCDVKEESEDSEVNNQEILDIVESLSDEEFGALLELLDDDQLTNLEMLLSDNE